MGRLIKKRRREIRHTEELSIVLREEWEKISPWVSVIFDRYEAVIVAKEGSTEY